MASTDELAALRRVTALDAGDTTYTDELLSAMIDAQGSISAAAAQVWRERAASTAGMVDTTESGSSRKLSDLHKGALDMAGALDGVDVIARGRRSFTTPIERQ
jgi:hypothetical protein